MATTAYLGVTKLELHQADKEVTINEAFDDFDAAAESQAEPPTYIAPTLLGSWDNYGLGHAAAGYLKHNGVVYLRGLVKSGSIGTAVFTLPVGYRPAADLDFPTVSNAAFGYVWVKSNGDVFAQAGSNAYFSLDSVRFVAGQ